MTEWTPEQEAISVLAEAVEKGALPWSSVSTADAIGLHAIWVELIKLDHSTEEVVNINGLMSLEKKRIEINIESALSDSSEFVEAWLSKVAKIAHAPSGWTLIVVLMGEPTRMRSVKFPIWHDGFGADD